VLSDEVGDGSGVLHALNGVGLGTQDVAGQICYRKKKIQYNYQGRIIKRKNINTVKSVLSNHLGDQKINGLL
jgi:hypothetical protein